VPKQNTVTGLNSEDLAPPNYATGADWDRRHQRFTNKNGNF